MDGSPGERWSHSGVAVALFTRNATGTLVICREECANVVEVGEASDLCELDWL